VTRQERAISDDDWISAFLERTASGVLATALDGQPFQSTLMFAFAPARRAIYLHTARRGRVWENLHANPQVCFTAHEMGRLLPDETALNFSVEYSSVVIFGRARLVEDALEAEYALQQLLDKYFVHLRPGRDYRPITPGELAATAVFRLEVDEWSGKRKAAADDFPGAFYYGA